MSDRQPGQARILGVHLEGPLSVQIGSPPRCIRSATTGTQRPERAGPDSGLDTGARSRPAISSSYRYLRSQGGLCPRSGTAMVVQEDDGRR